MFPPNMDAVGISPRPNKPIFSIAEEDQQYLCRPCLFCDAAPVVPMQNPVHGRCVSAFCCQACAAEYALMMIDESDLAWCVEHQCWSDELGICPVCCNVRFYPVVSAQGSEDEGGAA